MQVVRVRLRKPRRVFSFRCGELSLSRGDACIVQSDHGTEWGACVLPPEPCSPEVEEKTTMNVLRKATFNDERNQDSILEQEEKALGLCLKRIEKRELKMKLVDVEFTFDNRKAIFYFTAEERVDFRELVRDLAHELRTRIEMRHIQVRDEAKMVGGIGSCGRELCCTTWLREFKPVSMRMAKRQNLSLNPSKISGQCGRLLCCLTYENDLYEPFRKKKPVKRPPAETARQEERKETAAVPASPPEREAAPEAETLSKVETAPKTKAPPKDAEATSAEGGGGGANARPAEDAPRPKRRGRRRGRRRRNKPSGGESGGGGGA